MRVMIADQHISVRTALRLFLQEQEGMEIVSEVSRVGELMRDAPAVAPDLILMNWNLPDFKQHVFPPMTDSALAGKATNPAKAVVISSLHRLPSNPMIIAIGNQLEERLPILYSGADLFLYQGALPVQILSLLKTVQEERARV